MAHFLLLNGPNLDLLGQRQTDIYGELNLETIISECKKRAGSHTLTAVQSNSEPVLIEAINQAKIDRIDGIIFNPAAFTHTSIALRDCLLANELPFIEVHLSNIYARETFRQHSYFSDLAQGVVSGLGAESYYSALAYFIQQHETK